MDGLLAALQRTAWMIAPRALEPFVKGLVRVAARKTRDPAPPAADERSRMRVEDGVALIPVNGVLIKDAADARLLRRWGFEATAYEEITADLRAAVNDASAESIRLLVESPGGISSGLYEAGEEVYAVGAIKPLTADIDDLGASAAYWLASQAGRVSANPPAEVGSIGVYTYLLDWTGFEERVGIKTIVVRSGPYKATGVDGVTEEQLGPIQEVIDGLAAQFVDAVSRGRRMDRTHAESLASGRTWLAEEALRLGLIDEIRTPSGRRAAAQDRARPGTSQQEVMVMAKDKEPQAPETPAAPVFTQEDVDKANVAGFKEGCDKTFAAEAERLKALETAFPAEPAFVLAQFKAGADLAEAKAAFVLVENGRLKAENAALKESRAQAASVMLQGVSAAPHSEAPAPAAPTSGPAAFNAAVEARMAEAKCTRGEAITWVAQNKPDLANSAVTG